MKRRNYFIGIDEAGRGSLAGPVVVAGVRAVHGRHIRNLLKSIRDSKKLSPKKREEWFGVLVSDPGIKWAVARVGPRVIDRVNISKAANLGAGRVYKKLSAGAESPRPTKAWLDGGLYLSHPVDYETIIKGDEKVPLIAAASILAKVTRDKIMRRLHKKFPKYCFDVHKGYGTFLHRHRLGTFGPSPAHRRSFF